MSHDCTVTVRGYECDSYNHVNNAVYLNYLEYARTEFMKAIHLDYGTMRASGFGFVISHISIHYLRPAFYDEELRITTTPTARRRTSGTFRQEIHRGEELIVDAEVTWATINQNGRPTVLPEEFDRPELGPQAGPAPT